MGLLDVASAYEKMLQNPENRKNSSGTLTQQKPSLIEAQSGGGSATPSTPKIEDSDDLWMKELDKRMGRKKNIYDKVNEATGAGGNVLLKEMMEMKKMLQMVMDVNLKLLEKFK